VADRDGCARGGGGNVQRAGGGERGDCYERDGNGGGGAAKCADSGDLSRVAIDGGTGKTAGADAAFCDGEPDRGEADCAGVGAERVYAGAGGTRDVAVVARAERAGGAAAGPGRGPETAGAPRGRGGGGGGKWKPVSKGGWQPLF